MSERLDVLEVAVADDTGKDWLPLAGGNGARSQGPVPWSVVTGTDASGDARWWLRRHAETWASVLPRDLPTGTTPAAWGAAAARRFEALAPGRRGRQGR